MKTKYKLGVIVRIVPEVSGDNFRSVFGEVTAIILKGGGHTYEIDGGQYIVDETQNHDGLQGNWRYF